ncbi:hypothetical protein Btru_074459 [Bulinus truncatus]|nr:hypothetical protein Btru_074459 [Bulinus truncatus]
MPGAIAYIPPSPINKGPNHPSTKGPTTHQQRAQPSINIGPNHPSTKGPTTHQQRAQPPINKGLNHPSTKGSTTNQQRAQPPINKGLNHPSTKGSTTHQQRAQPSINKGPNHPSTKAPAITNIGHSHHQKKAPSSILLWSICHGYDDKTQILNKDNTSSPAFGSFVNDNQKLQHVFEVCD